MKLFLKYVLAISFVFVVGIRSAEVVPLADLITAQPTIKHAKVAADLLAARVGAEKQTLSDWYIFTGGPGTGKTCVLKELASRGYATVAESATDVIAQELKNGEKTPWSESWFEVKVAALMAQRQAALTPLSKIAFFDRGPVDPLSYILWYSKPINVQAISALDELLLNGSFKPTVFVFQDLGVCENTEIRHETVAEMVQIEERLIADYASLGFKVIKVPSASIKARADFILMEIGEPVAQQAAMEFDMPVASQGISDDLLGLTKPAAVTDVVTQDLCIQA